ncbi:MAG TPA: hypothetical protein DDZ41_09105 [Flavobacterium sp.]|nr:hypothetical protein [Flavobacterium sp.]
MDPKALENYLFYLEKSENDFKGIITFENSKNKGQKNKTKIKIIIFILKCLFDYLIFQTLRLLGIFKKKSFIYTALNFCYLKNGVLKDRIHEPLQLQNYIYINQSKEIYIHKINNKRVYNFGGLVKIVALFMNQKTKKMGYFKAYQCVNNSLFWRTKYRKIYFMWFYDLNSLSISFSKYRQYLEIIEIQHGSIINYPPYSHPAPVQLIDTIYVKNKQTIEYLKNHFCKNFECNYKLIPQSTKEKIPSEKFKILYASTIEFNGLHPIFKNYLNEIDQQVDDVYIRLHPREKHKKELFVRELLKYNISFQFDESDNWIESINYQKLIVISPWSSTIEDAYDNDNLSIIIDEVGKKRFNHLIDYKKCYFSQNIKETIKSFA